MSLYICEACFEEATPTCIDEGIGSYEYAGAPGVDVRMCVVSQCCESTILIVDDSTDERGDVAPYSDIETREVNYTELTEYAFDYEDPDLD